MPFLFFSVLLCFYTYIGRGLHCRASLSVYSINSHRTVFGQGIELLKPPPSEGKREPVHLYRTISTSTSTSKCKYIDALTVILLSPPPPPRRTRNALSRLVVKAHAFSIARISPPRPRQAIRRCHIQARQYAHGPEVLLTRGS